MLQPHEIHLHFTLSFGSHGHSPFVPLIFIAAGVGIFANGFWNYRKLRIIENTPRIAVRSVAMGLVHVHGKATGRFLLTSPLTHTPCYCYRVRLDRWKDSGKNRGWNSIHSETDQRVFYIDDGTGKVVIDPQAAEYDLPTTYSTQLGPKAQRGPYLDPSLGTAAGPSEDELGAYVAKADPLLIAEQNAVAMVKARYANASGLTKRIVEREKQRLDGANPLTRGESYRFIEHCLVAEHEYDVIGTCAENPKPQDDEDRNLILKGHNEPTFVISGFSELTLEKILRKRAVRRIALGGALLFVMAAFVILSVVKP